MSLRRRSLVAVLGLALVMNASASHAQNADTKAAADKLFNDAKSLMDRKDYEGACPKFAESLRIDPGIGVMLYLADCYEKQGKLASAWATFREAGELATKQGDTKRADVGKKHAAALEPNLSTMTITVAAGDIPGLVVTRNGTVVGKAQWGVAIPVDAGAHQIAATAPDRQKWESTAHVPGDRARVTITVPQLEPAATTPIPPPPASTPPPLPTTSPSGDAPPPGVSLPQRKIIALAVGGVGVVGVGLGTFFGLSASSKLSDSNAPGNCSAGNHCTAAGGQLRNDAQSAATISTIAFIVGAAAIAGGVVLWFTAPKQEISASANARPRVGVTGTTTGKDGFFVVHGAW